MTFALIGSSEARAANQATFVVAHRSIVGLVSGSSCPRLANGPDWGPRNSNFHESLWVGLSYNF